MKTKARRVDMWHRACLLLVLTGCARGALPPPATVPAGGAKPPADGVDTTSAAVEPDGEPTEKDAFRPVGVAPVKTAADSPATFWDDRDDLLDAPEPPQPRVFALPHATKTRLRNGLRVVMLPADEAQTEIIAHATLAVRAGVLDEPLDATGVAGFTASLLRRGTQDLSAQQIEQLLAQAGASFDVQVEDDLARLDCAVAADHLAVCLALLAQMVRTPLFPTPEMATLAGSVLESIQQRNSDPSSLGQDHLANLVFGDDHPLGRPLTAAALGRLTRAVVQDFWRAHYRPNNAVLVLTGAVNPADAGILTMTFFDRSPYR